MSFNADELEAPEWVNSDFLKKVLEYNGDLKNVAINDFHISPATALGDHFASIMFRAKIKFSTQEHSNRERSIIIKTLPVVDGVKKDMLGKSEVDFFGTEMFMYSNVLSECGKILRKSGYNDLLAPKMIYQSSEPQKTIVFEDLKELGYFMFPKIIPNENDTKLIFSKLGQYHAAAFKLAAEGTKGLNRKGGLFNLGSMEMLNMFRDQLSFFKELVETLPGFEEASEKLSKITLDKVFEKCRQAVNAPGSYEVLNHGDYHIKNMMFKGKNGTDVSEIVLVDFQICHWGSPAYDVVYMSAVIPPNMRSEAYKHYFDTFIDVLKKSDYDGPLPTFEQLQKDLKSYRCLELFFLATFTSFLCADKAQIKDDLDTLFTNSNLFKAFYHQPTYISYVKKLLPALLQDGVLDDVINSD
ncbi:unnamed protein product [Hermetia illucens]|uniref:CHK kinase-like domain-containing protein n=1 Tax=Hermetia illucens TaxID=343691 RepID=A0A7R8Z1H5_HERIL|nr:uncharacterized protein LOC119660338 isoform X1 [Hermetia illucens]CAD7093744.1 unnamed protein product [Hermetia illucens]